MRRGARVFAGWHRAALALVCAAALALNLFAMDQARAGKISVPAPQPPAIAAVAAPCPASAPARTICAFAGISAAMTAGEIASARASGATSPAVLHALRDTAGPTSPANDAPFRPPRAS